MRVLVVGLLPYDSGKTEFVRGLASVYRNMGYRVLYFKPVGGHNGWYQFDTVIHSLEQRVLIGHDAYVVASDLGLLDIVDAISPIDFLTLPINPLGSGLTIRGYLDYMSTSSKIMVLLRMTRVWFEGGELRRYHTYLLCRDTYRRLNTYLRELVDRLIAVFRTNNSIFVEADTGYVEKVLAESRTYLIPDEALEITSRGYDVVFIEGYNNVAAPTYGSLSVDYVFVVSPGKALLYDGRDYRAGVELQSYRGEPWTITSDRVVEILKDPLNTFDIPPFNHDKYYSVFESIGSFLENLRRR